MAITKVFNSEIRRQPSYFCALKSTSQATVADNSNTVVTWQSVTEVNSTGNFIVATNRWRAPESGWLDTTCTLTIDGGTNGDDTMVWGFAKNGADVAVHWDNWRKFSKKVGSEYTTYCIGAFAVNAGDEITVQYRDTSYSVNIYADRPLRWSGIFYPSRL